MGSVIGKVTDAVGLTDNKGAAAASKTASQQSAASIAMTKEQLDFEKEQYAEWKSIYGPIQEDLGTYFKNLTGGNLSAPHIQAIQEEAQIAQTQIDQTLAQRGISGGGLEAALTSQNIFQAGMKKAEVRAAAEPLATTEKMKFLSLGLGQGSNLMGTMAQTSAQGASALSGMSSSSLSRATILKSQALDVTGSVLGAGATMVSDKRLKSNLKLVRTIDGINFYTWDWNKKAEALGYSGKGFGVIAQEVKDQVPNSVYTDRGYMGVNYQTVLDEIKDN